MCSVLGESLRGGRLILDRRRRPRKPAFLIWKPRPAWPGLPSDYGEAPLREGVLAITVSEWTRDIALILSGVAGLLHWGWWFPVLFGAIAAVVREASQGFVLIQHCGSRYLIRSVTMTCLLCGVVATIGYMLSVI
jgi:hypothetical protein